MSGEESNHGARWRPMAAIFAIALALRLVCFVGLIASDDLGYSRFAEQIVAGTFTPVAHHYAFRYALTVPVAAVYALFGIGECTLVLVPLLAASISVALLWWIAAELFDRRVAWLAAMLYATFPLHLHYATTLVPEPVAEVFVLAGVALWLRAARTGSAAAACGAGLLFGLAFLAKEAAVFVAFAVGMNALLRRSWRLLGWLVAGAAVFAAVELGYHAVVSGDPLLRLHSTALHEASPMAVAANEDLGYRLLKAYPRMMLVPNVDFGVHSLFVLLVALAWWCCGRGHRLLLLLWSALPWLYVNFGSSSLDHYFALPLGPRYLEFCYPPLFVAAGAALARLAARGALPTRCGLVGVAIIALVGVACGIANRDGDPRSQTVDELRAIARAANERGVRAATVVQAPEPAGSQVERRWQRAFQVLAPDVELVDDAARADVVVSIDAAGVHAAWR